MLHTIKIPGLFITATDTGVGKTVIASAIADWFHRRGHRVGVCKIAATGCVQRGDELVSEDAESLARASGSRFDLETICPIRYAEPLAPAVAAQRAGVPMDWSLLQSSLDTLVSQSDVMIVEGVGGVMVPMDDRHLVLDVACWLGLPTIVVARPGLGTINHTLLTVNALRSAGATVAAVVINRYPVSQPGVAEQTNPAVIGHWLNALIGQNGEEGYLTPFFLPAPFSEFQAEKWPKSKEGGHLLFSAAQEAGIRTGGDAAEALPVLCVVPEIAEPAAGPIAEIEQVDWARLAQHGPAAHR